MLKILLLLVFFSTAYCTAVEIVCDESYEYRSIDGSCNNLEDPKKGMSGNFFVRFNEGASYEDGISEPIDRGNARNISNILGAFIVDGNPTDPPKNDNFINTFESMFAQFINHDLQNNLFIEGFENSVEVPVFPGDPLYKPNATNNFIIISPSEGEILEETGNFEIINESTGWLDLSPIYGSNLNVSNSLRTFVDGKLKMSSYNVSLGPFPTIFDNLLPSQEITGLPSNTFFSTSSETIPTFGDDRGNENIALFLVNTAFYREHNRIAENLKKNNPDWDDEKLFQEARRYNIAYYQHIVFDSYLPLVLGNDIYNKVKKYNGYDETENVETSIIFSTGAFRYGHFTVGQWDLKDENNCPFEYTIPAGVLGPFPIVSTELPNAGQLGGAFTPAFALALSGGIDNVVKGLITEKAEAADIYMSESLRTITFGGSISAGIDIMFFDIMRGHFNGLPDYFTLRRNYYPGRFVKRNIYLNRDCHANRFWPEVDPLDCFLVINSDVEIAQKLQNLYGKVNNIDGIIGLMAEQKEPGEFLPRTIQNILLHEYLRKRDGDRFWYENNQFTEADLNDIKSRQFSDIIRDNLVDFNIYDNAFLTPLKHVDFPHCPI
jgi:hypothetical protein